jgi:hypothetical protein
MSRERSYNPANQEHINKREQPAYLNETFDKRTREGKIAERTQALMRAIYESNIPTQTLIPVSNIPEQLRPFISHSGTNPDISVSIEEIFDVSNDEQPNDPYSIRIIVWDTPVPTKLTSGMQILDVHEYFFYTPAQKEFMIHRQSEQPREEVVEKELHNIDVKKLPDELMDIEIHKKELRELLASAKPLLKITEETKQQHLTTMIRDVSGLQLPSFDTAVLFTISATSKQSTARSYQLRIWDRTTKELLHSVTLSM